METDDGTNPYENVCLVRTVLTLNAGSSSLKASLLRQNLIDCLHPDRVLIATAERLGQDEAFLNILYDTKYAHRAEDTRAEESTNVSPVRTIIRHAKMTHEQALVHVMNAIQELYCDVERSSSLVNTIVAVGHRVVHGGNQFVSPVVVNDQVLSEIEKLSHLAPLHNPANILGIRMAREMLPKIPSVAVFDTSFHSTIPPRASTYPLPKSYREDLEIRKYGFHGTSVKYVVQKASHMMRKMQNSDRAHWNIIVAHLGNGASVTAVHEGKSVDTTMGFTPLEGVMMGTRSGSIDPAIVSYVCRRNGVTAEEVTRTLNQLSGLKGVSDGDSDMRSIVDRANNGDSKAILAMDMFVYILAKFIASMCVPVMCGGGGIDALVFTAGIGENSPIIRQKTLDLLTPLLHVNLDDERNDSNGKTSNGVISAENGADRNAPLVLVIGTDEEAMICQESIAMVCN